MTNAVCTKLSFITNFYSTVISLYKVNSLLKFCINTAEKYLGKKLQALTRPNTEKEPVSNIFTWNIFLFLFKSSMLKFWSRSDSGN